VVLLKLRGLATCLVSLTLAATGCGANGAGAGRHPDAVVPIPAVLDSSRLVLPVEQYMFTDRDVAVLQQAQAALARSCMRRFGFDWRSATSGVRTGTVNAANTAHRYGLTDPDAAAASGYHHAEQGSGDSGRRTAAAPTTEEAPVLIGVALDGDTAPKAYRGITIPSGGCLGEATLELSGQSGVLGDGELVTDINVGSYHQSYTDSRVKAAFRRWSACMKAEGYEYPDPTAAPGDDPKFSGATPSAEEIAIAKSDVACKRQTNLVGIWYAVDRAYQQVATAHKAKALAAVKQHNDAELAKAHSVLAANESDGPPPS
jgi:hypothetical protein